MKDPYGQEQELLPPLAPFLRLDCLMSFGASPYRHSGELTMTGRLQQGPSWAGAAGLTRPKLLAIFAADGNAPINY